MYRAARDGRAKAAIDEADPARALWPGQPGDVHLRRARGVALGKPAPGLPSQLIPGHADLACDHGGINVVDQRQHRPAREIGGEQIIEAGKAHRAHQHGIAGFIRDAARDAFALVAEVLVARCFEHAQFQPQRTRLFGHAVVHRQPVAVLQMRVDGAQLPGSRGGDARQRRGWADARRRRTLILGPAFDRPLFEGNGCGRAQAEAEPSAQHAAQQHDGQCPRGTASVR